MLLKPVLTDLGGRGLNKFTDEFLRWALCVFDVDECEAWQAAQWIENPGLEADLLSAVEQALAETTPAGAAQILEDLGDALEFHVFILSRAKRVHRERRARELQTMPYREYLRTPEWRERAQATYARFDHRCAFCNSPDDLHAHHRTYDRRGGELPGDLTALCPSCHGVLHEWRELAAPVV